MQLKKVGDTLATEIIIRTDGKKFECTCGYFADESIPNEKAKTMCFTQEGQPKCPLFWDCWGILTKRRET